MGKRGPRARKIISEKWTPELAYAIGLLATDGCLSPPFSLIDLTSADREQLENFCKCVGVNFKITKKLGSNGKEYLRVQFKSVLFYNFLLSVGLTPAKSKTLGQIKVPDKYFFDFLRGVFDGDGSFYSYWDPRWPSSFMFYTIIASASPSFIEWLQHEIEHRLGIQGHITKDGQRALLQLKYAKADSLKLLRKLYNSRAKWYLSRKRLKIDAALGRVGLSL